MAITIFFYIIIFIMGAMFGSFYTLAVYRIPKNQDITHTHSYCPNCNHKLGFLDLIPILSYIFLGAKCRYCKQKIRPRYLILEIMSGLLFVLIAFLLNLNIYNLTIFKLIEVFFIVLYLTFVILLAGTDKENRKIEKSITIYGIVISIIYMVYLCILQNDNIYRYGIYLICYIVVLIIDTITLKKYAKSKYVDGILLSIITMAIFTGEYVAINSIILTLLAMSIYMIINKIKNTKQKSKKTDKQISKNISVGFYLGVSNILMLLVTFYCIR